jgi:hypothetical protein
VPASILVPQGQTSATFTISTSSQQFDQSSAISATHGGVMRTVILSVTPGSGGGGGTSQPALLTVMATGRSGNQVTSTPAGIVVPVGSTGSATFATGTRITLTVSNNREAIWSGACSSGGNRRRTCTFTISANANVTANVQ